MLDVIDLHDLHAVTGGTTPLLLPAPAPRPALPAPHAPQPQPFHPPAGMAPPKYSAGWWDLARASGNIR